MSPTKKEDSKISKKMERLEEIVSYFQEAKDVDVEEGLEKVKEGAVIIKELKDRLKSAENEFEIIKKELDSEAD